MQTSSFYTVVFIIDSKVYIFLFIFVYNHALHNVRNVHNVHMKQHRMK